MICHGRSGETSSVSIVPVSFSRVSEMAVISDEMIGEDERHQARARKRFELSRVGLNRMPDLRHDAARRSIAAPQLALVGLDDLRARRPAARCRCWARWRR